VSTPPEQSERRQTPRVDLLREFQGHLIALDEPIRVRQLSQAGMTVAAAVPLSPAHTHDIQLTLGDLVVTLKARVVHTKMTIDHGDEFTYVCGLAFIDPPDDVVAAINGFLAASGSEDVQSSENGTAS
jgi:PilZ domain